ncbi:hypothetical protein BHM03_00022164, partial [Ensete ventricosum]
MVCHVCILVPANLQDLMSEATNMTKKIELIEAHKRAQREGKKHHSLPYDRSYCPTVRISFCFIYETQEKSLLKENKLLHEK